jgi:hypothetical protein
MPVRFSQPFIMQLYAQEPENVPVFARSYFLQGASVGAPSTASDSAGRPAESARPSDVREEKTIAPVESKPFVPAVPAAPATCTFSDQHGVLVTSCWVCVSVAGREGRCCCLPRRLKAHTSCFTSSACRTTVYLLRCGAGRWSRPWLCCGV